MQDVSNVVAEQHDSLGHPIAGSYLTGPQDVSVCGIGVEQTECSPIPTRDQSGAYKAPPGGLPGMNWRDQCGKEGLLAPLEPRIDLATGDRL